MVDDSWREFLSQMRQILASRFSLSELQDLCFDLGVSYDSLPGDGTSGKARELITYCYRRDLLPALVVRIMQLRPTAFDDPEMIRETVLSTLAGPDDWPELVTPLERRRGDDRAAEETWQPSGADSLHNQVRNLIDDLEIRLRSLAQDVLKMEWGQSWQEKLCADNRFPGEKWLEKRQKDEQVLEAYDMSVGTVLDYTTLGELGQILLINWQWFRDIFQFGKGGGKQDKSTLAQHLELICDVRNRLAHNRPVHSHQLLKAFVACNEIKLLLPKRKGEPLWVEPLPGAEPQLTIYLQGLVESMGWELAEEQYEPLGLHPEPESLPIAGIEADLLSTSVREERAGRMESTSAQPLTTLGEVIESERTKLVLLGEPGVGKTTTLKRLALYAANQALSDGKKGALPIYVPLIDYGVASLMDLMVAAVNQFDLQIAQDQIREMLGHGGLLILLDGLNEVPPSDYTRCRAELRVLMRQYPRNRFVITDRPDYDGSLQASVFRLRNWEPEQIRHYVHQAMHRLGSDRDPEPLIERVLRDNNLRYTLANPLLLGLLTAVYHETGRIASQRSSLYYEYIHTLIARDRRKIPDDPVDDHDKVRLLSGLAYEARRQNLTGLTESFVREQIARQLQEWEQAALVGPDLSAAAVLESLRRGRWLRDAGTRGQLRFSFDVLRDFFVALALKERFEKGESLAELIADARWEEPVVLLTGLLGKKADPLVMEARKLGGVHLAARCVISAPMVPSRVEIVQRLARELSSTLEMRRRSAAALFIFLRAPEAIPSLVEALADENGAVRWNAALAIQRTLGDQAADVLFTQILENPENTDETLTTACVALGRSGSDEAVSALIRALVHPSRETRRRAAIQLGRLKDPVAMRMLERAAQEGPDFDIQAGAIRALSIAQSDSVREIARSCLDHSSPQVRAEARLALGRLGDETIIGECLQKLESDQPNERVKAIQDLEMMRATSAVEPLWNLLTDAKLRSKVARALAKIGGTDVLARAIDDLNEPDPALRRAAVAVLGQTNDDRAILPLVATLQDPDTPVRDSAADLLGNFGGRAVPALEQALINARGAQDETEVMTILRALRNAGSRMAIQLLAQALNDPRPPVARTALRYLGQSDPEHARLAMHEVWSSATGALRSQLSPLLTKLENRRHAELALDYGRAQDPGLLRELFDDLQSDISLVRMSAAQALGRIGEPEARPRLLELLEDENPRVRVAAIEALGKLGVGRQTLERLTRWLKDETESRLVKTAIVTAFALVGGERELQVLVGLGEVDDAAFAKAIGLAVVRIEQRLREDKVQLAEPESEAWRVEALKERLKSPLRRERQLAVEELVHLDLPEVNALLLSAAKDRHPFVRYHATVGLGYRRVEEAVPELAKLLRDENIHIRRAAIESLGRINTPSALGELGKVSAEIEVRLRERALGILENAASGIAVFNSWVSFLADTDEELRSRAIAALGETASTELTSQHLEVIERALQNQNPYMRSGMLAVLGSIRETTTVPLIVPCVKDENFYVRQAAIRSLSHMPTAQAITSLAEALDDWAEQIRLEAAKALRNSRNPDALLALRKVVRDADPQVVEQGLLAGIETPGILGVQTLAAFLKHPSAEVRLSAVEALVDKQIPEAGEALVAAIQDRRPQYRDVQWRAIRLAGEMRVRAAAEMLANYVGYSNKKLHAISAQALQSIGTDEVVPILLKHLQHEKPEIVITAIKLLGCSHTPEAVHPLVTQLKNDKIAIQIHAMRALGELGDPAVIGPLHDIAQHTENSLLRKEAIAAVGRIPDKSAVAVLVWALRHPDHRTKEQAEHILTKIDPKLVGIELIELLKHRSPFARQAAARLCGHLRLEEAVNDLVELCEDSNPYTQSAGATALGKIGSVQAVDALSNLIEREWRNRHVTKAAVEALTAIGSPKAVEAISRTLCHWAKEVRLSAVEGLARINTPVAMHCLSQAVEREQEQQVLDAMLAAFEGGEGNSAAHGLAYFVHHAEETKAVQATEALARNGSDRAIRALIEAMASEEESLRLVAIRAVGDYRVKRAIRRLLGALKRLGKEGQPTRYAAEEALIKIGSRTCVPELLRLLGHSNPYIRQAVCRVLGRLRSTEAIRPLADLLEVENPYTRQAAAEALHYIASEEAVEELVGVLEHQDWRIRRTALLALKEMRVESAVPAIAEALEDEKFYVRLAAVEALGSIGTTYAISALSLATLDNAPDIREKTLEILSSVPTDSSGIDAAANGLCLLLSDEDYERRRRVVKALAANPSHRAVRGLLQAVSDRDSHVRHWAVQALGERQTLEALEVLFDARFVSIRPVRQAANEAVDKIRSKVLEQLLDLATRKGKTLDVDWSRAKVKAQRQMSQVDPEWVAQETVRRLTTRPSPSRQTRRRPRETYLRLLGWTAGPIGHDPVRKAMCSKNRYIKLAAIEAAGDLGMKDEIHEIIKSARSSDPFEQQAAMKSLVSLQAVEVIPTLRTLVGDENSYIRVAAIRSLGELQAREAVGEIQEALADPIKQVRTAAVIALGEIGAVEATPAIVEALQDPYPPVRSYGASALVKLKAVSTADELITLLGDPDPHVVEAAVRACGQLRLVEAIDPLIELRMRAEPPLNNRASLALAEINSPVIVERLSEYAHHTDPSKHRLAIRALARLDLEETRESLRLLLGHFHSSVRECVVDAVKESPDPSKYAEILLGALEDEEDYIRAKALQRLASTDMPTPRPIIEAMLDDESTQVRHAGALALGRLGDPEAVPALLTALDNEESDSVERAIFRALARLGTPEAIQALQQWRSTGSGRTRLNVIIAVQAERLSEAQTETISRSPQKRLEDSNPYVRQAAIRQVAEQGLVETVPILISMLGDPNPYTCHAAIGALGLLGERSAVEPLVALVRSPNPRIRSEVAKALGRLGDERALEPLILLLDDAISHVRQAAIQALVAIGAPRSCEILANRLVQGDPTVAGNIVLEVGKMSGAMWSEVLLSGLEHDDERVRMGVVQQLAGRADPVGVTGIRQALSDPNVQVVREAIKAVGKVEIHELTPAVQAFLTHENGFLRAEAAQVLGKLGATESLDLLTDATRDHNVQVCRAAAQSLGQIGSDKAVAALEDLLEHPENLVVLSAIQALSQIRTPLAAAALREALDHSDKFVREEAVEAIAQFPPELSVPYLMETASDANHFVREKTIKALGKLGQVQACHTLVRALEDPNVYVRVAAADSVGKVGCRESLPALIQSIKDENPFVRSNIIKSIGRISEGEHQAKLVESLEDPNSHVRIAAVKALSRRPSRIWYAAVAELAKSDPIQPIRSAARQALVETATPEAMLYVHEIDREIESLRELLQTPALQALKNHLDRCQSQGIRLEDEQERRDFVDCLTNAFLTDVPALHHQAAKLAARTVHPDLVPIYRLAIQDPLPAVRRSGAQAIAALPADEALTMALQLIEEEDLPEIRATLVRNLEVSDALENAVFQILEAALRDSDRGVVTTAVNVLSKTPHARSIELLRSVLRHSSDFVREAAANALGKLEAVETLEDLKELLDDPSWYVRQDAIWALAQMGDAETTLEACRVGSEDENPYVCLMAVQVLRDAVIPEAVPIFVTRLGHRHAGVRIASVQGIMSCIRARTETEQTGVNWKDTVKALQDRFEADTNLDVRLAIVDALDAWDLRSAVQFLQPYLFERNTPLRRRILALCERSDWEISYDDVLAEFQRRRSQLPIVVRRDISWAASRSQPRRCNQILMSMLEDSDSFVRTNAAYGLGQSGNLSAIAPLTQLLKDPARFVRETSYRALQSLAESSGELGRPAINLSKEKEPEQLFTDPIDQLLDWLKEHNVEVDQASEDVIREDSETRTLDGLLSRATSSNWVDRWYAVIALGDHPKPEAARALLRIYLRDENQTVQADAGRVLRQMPTEFVQSVIEERLNSDDVANDLHTQKLISEFLMSVLNAA